MRRDRTSARNLPVPTVSGRRIPEHPGLPTARELESALRQHVLDAWFPRCLDVEHGGFLCDFDRAWRPLGPHDKLLEFQARQTLLAAEAFRAFPHDQDLRAAALHGLRCLRGPLWDRDSGGWFHRLDRAGRPLEAGTKHAHGAAYAIEACVAVHEATGEPDALDLAREGFEWLEQHSHDREHGGYFGFLKRDGTVITDPVQCPWKTAVDSIGTEIGLKDANVHSDLLETLVYLYRAWPDPTVRERLIEVLDLLCDRMTVASTGALHIFATPDWAPVPHLVRSGYQCQGAFRFALARGVVGDEARLRRLAIRLLDHALRYTLDPRSGGFFYASPGAAPMEFENHSLVVSWKTWWIQVEALKALLEISTLAPENPTYLDHFAAQWRYIERNLLDQRYGGFYFRGLDTVRRRRRVLGPGFAPPGVTRKGDVWKDASHDGRALLHCLSALGGPGR